MDKILLLDLEETLIPIWNDFWPITENCRKISKFVKEFQPDKVETYSFAIWNDGDIETFCNEMSPIENAIGVQFTRIMSMEHILKDMKRLSPTLRIAKEDLHQIFGKDGSLMFLAMRNWKPNSHIVLIDDAVTDLRMEVHDTILEIKNIDNM